MEVLLWKICCVWFSTEADTPPTPPLARATWGGWSVWNCLTLIYCGFIACLLLALSPLKWLLLLNYSSRLPWVVEALVDHTSRGLEVCRLHLLWCSFFLVIPPWFIPLLILYYKNLALALDLILHDANAWI